MGQIPDKDPAGSDLSGSLWDVRAEGERLQGGSHSLQGGLPGGRGGARPPAETPLLPLGPRFRPMVGNGFCSPPCFHRSISQHQENNSFINPCSRMERRQDSFTVALRTGNRHSDAPAGRSPTQNLWLRLLPAPIPQLPMALPSAPAGFLRQGPLGLCSRKVQGRRGGAVQAPCPGSQGSCSDACANSGSLLPAGDSHPQPGRWEGLQGPRVPPAEESASLLAEGQEVPAR